MAARSKDALPSATHPPDSHSLSCNDVRKMLGTTRNSVRSLQRRGKLHPLRVAGRYYFARAEVVSLMVAKRARATGADDATVRAYVERRFREGASFAALCDEVPREARWIYDAIEDFRELELKAAARAAELMRERSAKHEHAEPRQREQRDRRARSAA